MLVVSNEAVVQRDVKRNRLLFWIGVACLVGSMASLLVGAAEPTIVFIFGYPLLILGVLLSKRGGFNNRRHGVGGYQSKSEEAQIEDQLKGVPPRYHLYNWIEIDGQLYDHILVTPNGLLILKVKGQMGKVKAGHDHFRLKQGVIGWLGSLGEPFLGNPSRELAAEVKKLRGWFEKQGYDLPTDGIIVFNNPRSEISGAEEMSFPVCHIHDLKLAVRGWETELNMSAQEQQEVERLLIKALPAEQAEKVEQLMTMPEYKRKALLEAETPEKTEKKEKAEKKDPVARAKERAKAARAAAPIAANPLNQRVGLNGKPLPPKAEKERKARRDVEPLPKVNPGAFGQQDNRKK